MGPKKKKGEGEGGKGKSSKLTKMNEMDRVKYLERRFLFIKHFNAIHCKSDIYHSNLLVGRVYDDF